MTHELHPMMKGVLLHTREQCEAVLRKIGRLYNDLADTYRGDAQGGLYIEVLLQIEKAKDEWHRLNGVIAGELSPEEIEGLVKEAVDDWQRDFGDRNPPGDDLDAEDT